LVQFFIAGYPNRYSSCWRAFITEPLTKLRTVIDRTSCRGEYRGVELASAADHCF
jgi:hypothetical protein